MVNLHTNDTVQEKLSLVARFGVTIYYGSPNKKRISADRKGIGTAKWNRDVGRKAAFGSKSVGAKSWGTFRKNCTAVYRLSAWTKIRNKRKPV